MVLFITKQFETDNEIFQNPAVKTLMESQAAKEYPYPVLVDVEKAAALLSSSPDEHECENVLLLSRFSFMGTDGMRGKVYTEHVSGLEALRLFTRESILSRDIVKLSVKAFILMLENNGLVEDGDQFCTANDGRDLATGWCLNHGMLQGFIESGMNVVDLGVSPTPYVPLFMLEHGIKGGAMLTASHNPSNQNGIKFFINGKKLLSEGPTGDYILSAYMYMLASESSRQGPLSFGNVTHFDNSTRRISFLQESIPKSFTGAFRNMHLFVDAANGSWTDSAVQFFFQNGIAFTLTSQKPTGVNINANCGVAEIEGHALYESDEIPYAPVLVQKIYAQGHDERDDYPVYGIAVDGDGDRGFVLEYSRETDSVKVYDGDEEAYLIAAEMKQEGVSLGMCGAATGALTAVSTIESDCMATVCLQKDYGFVTDTVDVGDKWICNYPEHKLFLGFESSGHVIIPCPVKTPDGEATLLSGNGMLTALYTILSLQKGNKTFERGYSKTFYTYFVDKNLFYPGSDIWKADESVMQEGLAALPYKSEKVVFKDPNVLAYALVEGDVRVALLFSRNSGTEDKNAVYLKCRPDLADTLLPVAQALCDAHRSSMRKAGTDETKCVEKAFELLSKNGSFLQNELTNDTLLANAVLHALIREGKLQCSDGVYTEKRD